MRSLTRLVLFARFLSCLDSMRFFAVCGCKYCFSCPLPYLSSVCVRMEPVLVDWHLLLPLKSSCSASPPLASVSHTMKITQRLDVYIHKICSHKPTIASKILHQKHHYTIILEIETGRTRPPRRRETVPGTVPPSFEGGVSMCLQMPPYVHVVFACGLHISPATTVSSSGIKLGCIGD
jgi:hypothetical protein